MPKEENKESDYFEEPEQEPLKQEEPYTEEQEEEIDEETVEEISDEEIFEEQASFLEFLKWFASRFWWSLGLLLLLITAVLLVRTITSNSYYTEMNSSLSQLENNVNHSAI
jgi:hypothetical protein